MDKPIVAQVIERLLGGIEADDADILAAVGRTIEEMLFFGDALHITFVDGTRLRLTHDYPDCCAVKYLVLDDDTGFAKGAVFYGVVIKDAPDIDDGAYGTHEVQFGEVITSKGSVTLAAHNEHNGYYSGIGIDATFIANNQP